MGTAASLAASVTAPVDAPVAIVSAMHEELHALLTLIEPIERVEVAAGSFIAGACTAVPSCSLGIGKVAAAATATLLIDRFAATELLFTGVAGGLHPDVAVGDVVVARSLLQRDMDASPLFPRYEVPLTGRSDLQCRRRARGNARAGSAPLPALRDACTKA